MKSILYVTCAAVLMSILAPMQLAAQKSTAQQRAEGKISSDWRDPSNGLPPGAVQAREAQLRQQPENLRLLQEANWNNISVWQQREFEARNHAFDVQNRLSKDVVTTSLNPNETPQMRAEHAAKLHVELQQAGALLDETRGALARAGEQPATMLVSPGEKEFSALQGQQAGFERPVPPNWIPDWNPAQANAWAEKHAFPPFNSELEKSASIHGLTVPQEREYQAANNAYHLEADMNRQALAGGVKPETQQQFNQALQELQEARGELARFNLTPAPIESMGLVERQVLATHGVTSELVPGWNQEAAQAWAAEHPAPQPAAAATEAAAGEAAPGTPAAAPAAPAAPGEHAAAPGTPGAPAPGETVPGAPAPVEGAPAPGEAAAGAPAPVEGAPAPGEATAGAPAPVEGAPAPGEATAGAPAPVEEAAPAAAPATEEQAEEQAPAAGGQDMQDVFSDQTEHAPAPTSDGHDIAPSLFD